MDRGGNNNNKGKEQMVEEDQAGAGDGNNANPSNIVDTSGTNLGLSLELAPKGPPEEELSGAGGVIRRMRGLGAEGSSTGRRRMHKCKYCEKEFSTSQALGGHQNAHKPERAATKFQESLGKMGAMERDQMNMNRYQPYMFNPSRNVLGTLNIGGRPASGLASGVPPTRQQPIFQSHLSSFLSAGLGSGNRFPAPGQVPPPVVLPRQGGNEPAGSQGFSQAFRSWSEFLARPRNTATSGEGSSNIPIARSSGVPSTSGMGGDGRRLMYYPGGIGFGPQGLIGNNPNANVNQNLDLFGHNLHPNANLFGSVDHPAGNVNPDNNVGAGIGAAAAPPAEDNADGENENEGLGKG